MPICNLTLPFQFTTDNPSIRDDPKILAFDVLGWNDKSNSADALYNFNGQTQIALGYRDGKKPQYLKVGVMVETERNFEWLKQMSNAHLKSPVAIQFSNSPRPLLNVVYDRSEATFDFVSFDALNGYVRRHFLINKKKMGHSDGFATSFALSLHTDDAAKHYLTSMSGGVDPEKHSMIVAFATEAGDAGLTLVA